ncbi:LOW QUALITY PROTEIN: mas-related G-protein coupled receptor member B4-like [Peromyscus californicus insignis]|uniref:LOW QUALITY PROTEIN: mas-related G-protein coupled receptor member B4-like n=1 Tax=Peromyscus californicus insignis TaxID=564181 RepID=UPI0022A6F41B|nr:LOW QUALITY PROTEIN: mas-related G-protein coupled receptor member B4-like [Peromyscus californicus insignis]
MCSYLDLLCRNTSGNFSNIDPFIPAWNKTITNGSYYIESLHCVTMYKVINILTVIIAMIGLAGNAIVLWLLGFHMDRNAFSVYVLNLAGADFLFLCFQTVFSLERILSWFHNTYLDILISLINVLTFTYLVGMCMIAAISVEHCLSILWPIWYHCQCPRHMTSVLCALLWAFSLLLSFLLGDGCGLLLSDYDHSFCRTYNFIAAAFMTVLSVVPCGCNLALLVRIFCGSQRIPVTKLYVTISLTVLVFLLFGLPFGINWFLLEWIVEWYRVFLCNVYKMTAFLSCINSCANPIIYFLVGSIRHRRFQRQTLKMLLQRAMQDTPEEEGKKRASSGNPGEQETVWCSS